MQLMIEAVLILAVCVVGWILLRTTIHYVLSTNNERKSETVIHMLRVPVPGHDNVSLSGISYLTIRRQPALTVMRMDCYRSSTYKRESRTDWLGDLCTTHHYNFVAVDVRGTGQSNGVALDEYPATEASDTLAVARFIASQPWSNGKVMLYGLSYSSNLALRALLHQERECRGKSEPIIVGAFVLHASLSRFEYDVHFWGGVKTVTDWLQYAAAMTPFNMLPRFDPDLQRDVVDDRLTQTPWIEKWSAPSTSPYWQHGSFTSDDLRGLNNTPVFLYGGFHDLYVNSMVRLHHDLPHNIAVIGHSGHTKWSSHDAWLLWWLEQYRTVEGRTIYWLPQPEPTLTTSRPSWILTDNRPLDPMVVSWKWSQPRSVPLDLVYGPLFRYSSHESVCEKMFPLREQLESRAMRLKICDASLDDCKRQGVIAGIARVRVQLAIDPEVNAGKSLYLVAWLLDGCGRLCSIGTQRQVNDSDVLDIEMSAICLTARHIQEWTLYLSTSNVPNLVPQFGLEHPPSVLSCELILPLRTVGDVDSRLPKQMFLEHEYKDAEAHADLVRSVEVCRTPEGKQLFRLQTVQNDEDDKINTSRSIVPSALPRELTQETLELCCDSMALSATFVNTVQRGGEQVFTTYTRLEADHEKSTLSVTMGTAAPSP